MNPTVQHLLARMQAGQPVVLSADPRASLRAEGVSLDERAPLGPIVREHPTTLSAHYEREVAAGVDVLFALTGETMPRSLAQAGMAFRSAALTGAAVELALEAVGRASRPVAVAGVIGSRIVGAFAPDRVAEECAMHAARLAAAGCEVIVACGVGPFASRVGRTSAIVSASTLRLPTWALVEVAENGVVTADGEDLTECAKAAFDAGAQVLLLDVHRDAVAETALGRVSAVLGDATAGVILPDPHAPDASPDVWAEAARRLVASGAHVIGGGPGTTPEHIEALVRLLRPARHSYRP